jgi:glutamyl-tRNA synthetase
MKIVTRFPPSPTGNFHIGSARTALFNYLFTRHFGGTMYLRFEDTDKTRSKQEYEDDILAGLSWLGIEYTLPTVSRQSERTDMYRSALKRLIDAGTAYVSREKAKDESGREVEVVRLRNPGTLITFTDLIRGEITFDTTELGDFVIARSIDEPLYHLAVVVDDHDMGVTHIIRGEDHISNTPRQILIMEALGFARPQYAHIPLILAPDRSKLSKRHGATSVNEYRQKGFLPEAFVNYLALLGWNPGGERELFSLDELAKEFSIEHIHKGGAIFDVEKLRWFNHQYLLKRSLDDYEQTLLTFAQGIGKTLNGDFLKHIGPELRERAKTLEEALTLYNEFEGLNEEISYSKELLLKGAKADPNIVQEHLRAVVPMLQTLNDAFDVTSIKDAIFPYATEKGRASVLWPMRVALSGKEKSPDPFTLAALLGKQKTLERLESAMALLGTV